jgi:hypothetical protein
MRRVNSPLAPAGRSASVRSQSEGMPEAVWAYVCAESSDRMATRITES